MSLVFDLSNIVIAQAIYSCFTLTAIQYFIIKYCALVIGGQWVKKNLFVNEVFNNTSVYGCISAHAQTVDLGSLALKQSQ